jgi:hypothetical protein
MARSAWRPLGIMILLGFAGTLQSVNAQGLPPVPQHGDATHLGVASCASSACHGASSPAPGGVVLQNEYSTWQRQDAHSGAYALLLNEDSKLIARKLGIEAAHEADMCLDCHADNVPEERRGPKFQVDDGIGCEACHGGAENWLQLHTVNDNATSHGRNVDAGLYPTDDPEARAKVCLSCHLGDETQFVTHRIMGAGHPRLSFELDTFTAIEPAHYLVDADYRERKDVSGGVQTWAVGQAMTLASTLELVTDSKWGRAGLFPELSFFDCHACHKPMSAGNWRYRGSAGLGPGVVRFNDASLIMTRVIADTIAPSLGEQLRSQGRALHRATAGSAADFRSAAGQLLQTARRAVDTFGSHDFSEAELKKLIGALVEAGENGEYSDYVAAEQTTMAIGTIATAMRDAGYLDEASFGRYEAAMDEMYAVVEDDERYRPSAHLTALRKLRAVQ